MPEDAIGWYEHISESIDMLRSELRAMEKAGATPEEFGLKVRAHPDTLIVTAREKMGSGEKLVVRIGLGNSFIETATLRRDEESLKTNLEAGRRLALNLAGAGYGPSQASRVQGGYLLSSVPVAPVREFLSAFQNHPLSIARGEERFGNPENHQQTASLIARRRKGGSVTRAGCSSRSRLPRKWWFPRSEEQELPRPHLSGASYSASADSAST